MIWSQCIIRNTAFQREATQKNWPQLCMTSNFMKRSVDMSSTANWKPCGCVTMSVKSQMSNFIQTGTKKLKNSSLPVCAEKCLVFVIKNISFNHVSLYEAKCKHVMKWMITSVRKLLTHRGKLARWISSTNRTFLYLWLKTDNAGASSWRGCQVSCKSSTLNK